MKLLGDWKQILTKAWSIRFMVLAGVFSAAEVIVPLYADAIPRNLFAILSGISVAGAFISRLLAQNSDEEKQDAGKQPKD